MIGKVKFINETKGFGFIKSSEVKEDIFVHISGLQCEEICEYDHVEFDVEEGKKGMNAINVRVLNRKDN